MTTHLDYIVPKVDVELIKKELTPDRFLRKTNKLNNEIYVVNAHNSPNIMREIGRLREVTFATAGGGTGEALDIDDYDTNEHCYEQLIVWSPEDEEIIGGYRFIDCNKATQGNHINLSTTHYFNFSDTFKSNYLPKTIELGRSWIQPNFQPTKNPRKGLFALDNLWDGLGGIVVTNPHIEYFFGKVTMYTSYQAEANLAVLAFMHHYFPDKEQLVTPIHPIHTNINESEVLSLIDGLDFKEGLKVLQQFVRERGENIPPLINNYMQLSPTMKTFGTAENTDFGDVEETGILIKIHDIYEEKKARHIDF